MSSPVAGGREGGKLKIKIDNRGFLYIDGITKRCPLNYPDQCGTWCALFTVHAWDHGNHVSGADVTLFPSLSIIGRSVDGIRLAHPFS